MARNARSIKSPSAGAFLIAIVALFAALALAAAGCGGKKTNPSDTSPDSVVADTVSDLAIPVDTDSGADDLGLTDASSKVLITPTLPTTAGEHTFDLGWEGTTRKTYLFIPAGYNPATPAPLMFALHGGGEDVTGFRTRRQALVSYADQQGVILVIAQGVDQNGEHAWNGKEDRDTIDDVGFFVQVIAWLQSGLSVDSARIYMAGFSNGGGMTQRFAAERPDLLRAAVSICMAPGYERPEVGTTLQLLCGENCHTRCGANCSQKTAGVRYSTPTPLAPISIALIRGGADLSVCNETRCGLYGKVYDNTAQSTKFWLTANGCDEAKFSETTSDGTTLRKYESCGNSTVVHAIFDPTLDHSWLAKFDKPVLDFLLAH